MTSVLDGLVQPGPSLWTGGPSVIYNQWKKSIRARREPRPSTSTLKLIVNDREVTAA